MSDQVHDFLINHFKTTDMHWLVWGAVVSTIKEIESVTNRLYKVSAYNSYSYDMKDLYLHVCQQRDFEHWLKGRHKSEIDDRKKIKPNRHFQPTAETGAQGGYYLNKHYLEYPWQRYLNVFDLKWQYEVEDSVQRWDRRPFTRMRPQLQLSNMRRRTGLVKCNCLTMSKGEQFLLEMRQRI